MLFETLLYVCVTLLCICLVLTMVRFVLGPSLPDRVVALDVFSANLIAILAIYSILAGSSAYLSIALSFSLVTFVGTMSFAYYLLQKDGKNGG